MFIRADVLLKTVVMLSLQLILLRYERREGESEMLLSPERSSEGEEGNLIYVVLFM